MSDDCEVNVNDATTGALTAPLKWHGGKHYLTKLILARMPRHLHYVEPFFGGGKVLFARDPDDERFWWGPASHERGVSELVNDAHGHLMNFYRVMRDPALFAQFRRVVEAILLSRAEWERAHAHQYGADPVADAVAFFVDCRQSLAGRMKGFTGITKSRTRREMNGNVSE
jgi:DNA adenine methylase